MSEIIYGRNPVIEALGSGKVEKILIASNNNNILTKLIFDGVLRLTGCCESGAG